MDVRKLGNAFVGIKGVVTGNGQAWRAPHSSSQGDRTWNTDKEYEQGILLQACFVFRVRYRYSLFWKD